MMAGIGNKWGIDKLNESNWSTWKFQMRHLLTAKEVWEHVDGSAQPPGKGADAAAHARHNKAQQKAMATLVMEIGSSQIYLVTSCTTPKDVWDTLKAQLKEIRSPINYFSNGSTLRPKYVKVS